MERDPPVEVGAAYGVIVALFQWGWGQSVFGALLLPATMKMLGPRNWYLPRWLQWLPQISSSAPPPPPPPPTAGRPPRRPVTVA